VKALPCLPIIVSAPEEQKRRFLPKQDSLREFSPNLSPDLAGKFSVPFFKEKHGITLRE
jgi:hypothetical protein